MANKRITELTDVGTPDGLDVLEIVDVSDTTDSPEGTSKKVLVSALSGGGGSVTSVNSDTGAVIVDLQSATDEGNVVEYGAETTFAKFQTSANVFAQIASDDDGFVNIEVSQGTGEKSTLNTYGIDFQSGGNNYNLLFPPVSGSLGILDQYFNVSFTAKNYVKYYTTGTITVTDPTPTTGLGYAVHVVSGTSTIGGVGYTTGDLVYRYYDGSSWISKNYNQDLQSVLTNGGTVIEGDNELYLDVVNGQLEFGTVGAVSSSFFKVNSDEDIIIANANNVSQKNASIQIDTDGNLELIQKNATNTFGTGITITEPTANRSITFKDESGTVALISDIPSPITIDATPTDGSANAVSSNGVFDALATKVSKSDYTPAHSILVQQSGTGTPTALSVGNNTLVGRLSGGGSDIDDLSVSDVRTLLDIDTDLALKVNKSRFIYQGKTSITGVTGETNLCSFKIDGGTYENTDAFKFDFTPLKSVTASSSTWKVYIGLTSGARTNQIMQLAITNTNRIGDVTRRYNIDSGNLDTSVFFTANAQSGLSGISVLNTPISVDMDNDLWITITANPTVSTESHGVLMASITPLK